MVNRSIVMGVALLGMISQAVAPALAQDSGGLAISQKFFGKGGIAGLARPLPFTQTFVTARDMQASTSPAGRSAKNQLMIAKLRGDSGFLGGFQFGTPLAASRQAEALGNQGQGQDQGFSGGDDGFGGGDRRRHRNRTVIINNLGPVAITNGNGNLVQQQSSTGATGPVAQQQVATTSASGSTTRSGGAVNAVTPNGTIIQRPPR
jgi:hypothetical protein